MPKKEPKIGEAYVPKITEDDLQKRMARWLDIKCPGEWCHIPNGGSRHLLEAVKLKAMGVKPGFPDIMIFRPITQQGEFSCCGFFVELKVGKNKCSDNQLAVQKMLREAGWQGTVAYTFEDATMAIEDYFAGKFVS